MRFTDYDKMMLTRIVKRLPDNEREFLASFFSRLEDAVRQDREASEGYYLGREGGIIDKFQDFIYGK